MRIGKKAVVVLMIAVALPSHASDDCLGRIKGFLKENIRTCQKEFGRGGSHEDEQTRTACLDSAAKTWVVQAKVCPEAERPVWVEVIELKPGQPKVEVAPKTDPGAGPITGARVAVLGTETPEQIRVDLNGEALYVGSTGAGVELAERAVAPRPVQPVLTVTREGHGDVIVIAMGSVRP